MKHIDSFKLFESKLKERKNENLIDESNYDSTKNSDDVFFLWDETVDDDRKGIEYDHDRLMKENDEYAAFFAQKLADWNVDSPADLDDEKKKKFFDEIKAEWKG